MFIEIGWNVPGDRQSGIVRSQKSIRYFPEHSKLVISTLINQHIYTLEIFFAHQYFEINFALHQLQVLHYGYGPDKAGFGSFRRADVIEHRAQLAGREGVQVAMAFLVLSQQFLQLFGHGQAVFAVVFPEDDLQRRADFDAELIAQFFVHIDKKRPLAFGHQRALKRLAAVEDAHHAALVALHKDLPDGGRHYEVMSPQRRIEVLEQGTELDGGFGRLHVVVNKLNFKVRILCGIFAPNNEKNSICFMKTYPKTVAEFFAGIGLMRIGLERAGWQILYANDIDPVKEMIYTNHFKDTESHFDLGDIHQLSGDDIPDVTLATASFPCTDLSLAGRRHGLSGKQSSAFWGFVSVIESMGNRKPKLILIENVEGFLTSNKGDDIREALLALNNLDYNVDAFIIDAARFVPQSRVRLFIVGVQNGSSTRSVLTKQLSFFESPVRTKKLANFIMQNPDINWEIRDLPTPPNSKIRLRDIVDTTTNDLAEWWSEERVSYLLNQTFDRHRTLIEIAKAKDEYTYFTAFRRVREGRSMAEIRSDGIAGCLRTPKGGSARQILIRAGKNDVKIRLLSPREYAKLMGVGDYNITGTTNQALFGFGDAVCVPVVSWIAKHYLNPILEALEESTKNEIRVNGYSALPATI